MATLYELSGEYARLMGELESVETREQAEEICGAILRLDDDINGKADAFARILRNKLAEAEMYRAEKQRFERLQKAAERTAEWIRRQMLDSMLQTDTLELPTSIGKWRRQLNGPSVEVLDEGAVPEEFRIPQPDKIDKRRLLEHYRETGKIVDGTDVVRTEGVRFR